MKCDVCKGSMVQENSSYKTKLNGEEVIIEDVPVWVCQQCDATLLDEDVIEAIEDMLKSLAGGLADKEAPEEIDLN